MEKLIEGAELKIVTPAKSENTPLDIVVSAAVRKVEFDGIEATTDEEKVSMIRKYVRNKLLKQFNIAEINKTVVTSGRLYFNEGNRVALKLPKVKLDTTGAFAEDLQTYFNRVKPEIKVWLVQSCQMADVTEAFVTALA